MRFQAAGNPVEVRAELGVPPEGLLLLYVGGLSRPGGMSSVVDAFAQTKNRWPLAALLMVGEGELEEPLAGHARRRKIPDARLLRFIPKQHLTRVYNWADFPIM